VLKRGLHMRLFLTCWLVFSMHFATDFVREHYLVVSIAEEGTFDLTKYFGLHVDIFQNPPTAPHGGAHHGANPGISMIAVLPYMAVRPAVQWVVQRELASRDPSDTTAVYRDETRPRRLEFYQKTRRMGLDVLFGLVGLVTAVLCMAPLAAASVVAVFRIMTATGATASIALGMSLVYAFATPVFLRASYLNQNLAIATFSVVAFLLLWNPGQTVRWSAARREVAAGFLGGLSFLSDYSGALSLGLLGAYLLLREWQEGSVQSALRAGVRYTLGALPPILALFWYQWASFGHPFYPPQHWMAPVDWIEIGYQGVGLPTPELFGLLLFDLRYGLIPSAPLFALAFALPFLARRAGWRIPVRELAFCFVISAAYVLFFSAVQYTRLQWVTGFRYLAPLLPFLFLPAAMALLRIPRIVAYSTVVLSLVISWSLTMTRTQLGIVDAVKRVMLEGPQLPALRTFSRMSAQYAPGLQGDASPLPFFALAAALLYAIWFIRRPWVPLATPDEPVTATSSPRDTGADDRPARD
jgi:hypothetical protein